MSKLTSHSFRQAERQHIPSTLALADSIYSSASSAAVGLITKQGVPHMLCMHPELERAPRLQPPLQQGCTNPANASSSCHVLMACLPVHTALRAPACSAADY